mmetsp:Transcript_11425/g.27406  ORF Transcript_11425/g.27406 Transcript_11425/m.27406 type:complete len:232 (+) Transcript_11425:119-814(+)
MNCNSRGKLSSQSFFTSPRAKASAKSAWLTLPSLSVSKLAKAASTKRLFPQTLTHKAPAINSVHVTVPLQSWSNAWTMRSTCIDDIPDLYKTSRKSEVTRAPWLRVSKCVKMARSSPKAGAVHMCAMRRKIAFFSSGCPAYASKHCVMPMERGGGVASNFRNHGCSKHPEASGLVATFLSNIRFKRLLHSGDQFFSRLLSLNSSSHIDLVSSDCHHSMVLPLGKGQVAMKG